METIKKSIAAGAAIGIGSTIYLSVENKIVGALLFSLGLFLVCSFGMFLFTGKIGYVISNKNKPNCAVIWLGNFIGSAIVCAAVRFASPKLHETAAKMVEAKLDKSLIAIAILAFFCGVLMYVAVENFRSNPNTVSGITGIVLCVSVFILSGFEQSIADMGYMVYSISSIKQVPSYLLFLLVVSVANGLGALAIRFLTEYKKEAK